jgi:hypothetical protein
MRRHLSEFSAADYFATESHIFRRLPGLRALLRSPSFETDVNRHLDRPILFKVRRFFVEQSVDFFRAKITRGINKRKKITSCYLSSLPAEKPKN